MSIATYYSTPPGNWLVAVAACGLVLCLYGIWRIATRGDLAEEGRRWSARFRLFGLIVLLLICIPLIVARFTPPRPIFVLTEEILVCGGMENILPWADIGDLAYEVRPGRSGPRRWLVITLTAEGEKRHRAISRNELGVLRCRLDYADAWPEDVYQAIYREWSARRS